MIDTRDFKLWMVEQGVNDHVAKDYASRAAKAEKCLMKSGQSLSFLDEYRKDNGESVMKLFSEMGKNIDEKADLPTGKSTIHNYLTATRKYFMFLAKKNS